VLTFLDRMVDPMVRPIRRFMPDLGGIDLSPAVLIIALIFIRDVLLRGLLMSMV
jgi:YggT family protein